MVKNIPEQQILGAYKQTEFGLFPVGWEIKNIGELLEFKNGLNKEKEFFGYGTPIINYMDVYKFSGLVRENLTGKVFVSREEIVAYSIRRGDVFFTRTSETVDDIGVSTVLLEDVRDGVFSGFVLRGRPKNENLELDFKKYCFNSTYIRKQISSTSSYTTRALTNGTLLSNVTLAYPLDKEEQTAIANALSDIDALITSLEKLIAKKRAIKTAAMQQLLTGEKRLPPFDQVHTGYRQTELGEIPKDWEIRKIGDFTDCTAGGTPSTGVAAYWDGNNPWMSSGELHLKRVFHVEEGITDFGLKNSSNPWCIMKE